MANNLPALPKPWRTRNAAIPKANPVKINTGPQNGLSTTLTILHFLTWAGVWQSRTRDLKALSKN
jgi:hypothetical protein